jgi:hypothetical protein
VQIFDIVFKYYKKEELNINGGYIGLIYLSAAWAKDFFYSNLFTKWKNLAEQRENIILYSELKLYFIKQNNRLKEKYKE